MVEIFYHVKVLHNSCYVKMLHLYIFINIDSDSSIQCLYGDGYKKTFKKKYVKFEHVMVALLTHQHIHYSLEFDPKHGSDLCSVNTNNLVLMVQMLQNSCLVLTGRVLVGITEHGFIVPLSIDAGDKPP